MKSYRVVFALLCSISLAQAGNSPKPLSPLQQTMIANEKSFIAAAKKGDAEYFKRALADDYSQVGVDGQLHDRQEILGELISGGVELTPYNLTVMAVGGGEAYTPA